MSKVFAGKTFRDFTSQGFSSQSTFSATATDDYGSFVSASTPNYVNIKKVDLPWRSHQYFHYKLAYSDGSAGYYLSWNPTWFFGVWGNCYGEIPINVVAPFLSADLGMVNEARGKLLDTIKDAKINIAQAFAERKQTASLIINTVNRLASAAIAIRRGKLVHAHRLFGAPRLSKLYRRRNGFTFQYVQHPELGKHLAHDIVPSPKNLANHWNEFSYGWRPLVQDIYGAAELLANTFVKTKPMRVTSFKSASQKGVVYKKSVSSVNPKNFEMCTSEVYQQARYVVEFVEDSQFATMAAQTGLSNPALLAWELVPYSFVVDWVLPIGDYLSRLDATRGLIFKRGTLSEIKTATHVTRWDSTETDPFQYKVSGCGKVFSYKEKTRTALSSFPNAPPLTVNPNLGITRLISGLALLVQAFSGRKK